jgi:general secretion pathway protein C
MRTKRWYRTLAFFTWLLVGLSAAYWGLRLGEPAPSLQSGLALPVATAAVDAAAVVAVLGGSPAPAGQSAPLQKRFELVGVVAEGRKGVALLSIDGQPAQPFLVGAAVDKGLKLHAVAHRRAELADAASGVVLQRLEMPAEPAVELPAGMKLVQIGRP